MDRLAEGLALDVPKRLVDASDRRHVDRTASVEACAVHDLPMIFDQKRVFADQIVFKLVHRRLHRQRATFNHRLAPADHASICFDLQKQPARRHDIGRQLGDLHAY